MFIKYVTWKIAPFAMCFSSKVDFVTVTQRSPVGLDVGVGLPAAGPP